jgi:hypothetical protein
MRSTTGASPPRITPLGKFPGGFAPYVIFQASRFPPLANEMPIVPYLHCLLSLVKIMIGAIERIVNIIQSQKIV